MSAYRRCPALPRGIAFDDGAGRFYLIPAGLVAGELAAAMIEAGTGWPLAGGEQAFTSGGVAWRDGEAARLAVAPFADLVGWAGMDLAARPVLDRIGACGRKRAPWAGLELDRPRIMGIVNVTPDSFSDGGAALVPEAAIARGLAMVAAGADIVDVGGESTRPGARPVSEEEERARVLPVVAELARRGIIVSIDTRHASVMEAALAAGAVIINDVAALREPGALAVAANSDAALCLMHMQGEPATMLDAPVYRSAPLDVFDFLAERVAACRAAGIDPARIAVDPGIGFGKTALHNAQILAALTLYHGLGCPVLLGASRKRFIAAYSRGEAAGDRLGGSLAAVLKGIEAGAQIVRVHDVAETAQAIRVWRAMRQD
jgi:dihydropteroate synthase